MIDLNDEKTGLLCFIYCDLFVLIYSCNSFNAHRRLILLCVCVVEEEGRGICVWVGCWMDECACV